MPENFYIPSIAKKRILPLSLYKVKLKYFPIRIHWVTSAKEIRAVKGNYAIQSTF